MPECEDPPKDRPDGDLPFADRFAMGGSPRSPCDNSPKDRSPRMILMPSDREWPAESPTASATMLEEQFAAAAGGPSPRSIQSDRAINHIPSVTASWSKSAEEQASGFLDVIFPSGCSPVSDLPRSYPSTSSWGGMFCRGTFMSEGDSTMATERTTNSLDLELQSGGGLTECHRRCCCLEGVMVHAKLVIATIIMGVLMPAILFCVLTPLMVNGLPMELWHMYYCGFQTLLGLCFAEQLSRACFAEPSGWRFLVIAWLGMNLICIGALFVQDPNLAEAMHKLSLISTVTLPSMRVLVLSWLQKRHPVAPEAFHILGLIWTLTPAALSVLLSIILLVYGWASSSGTLAVFVILWTAGPLLVVRPIGAYLFRRGSPASKFLGTLYWSIFSDVAFGTLGLLLFVHSTFSSLSYMLSLGPVLLLCVLRGLPWAYRHSHRVERLHLHRLSILLEAFSAVLGRCVAYTLYLCSIVMQLAIGEPPIERPRLFAVHGKCHKQSIDYYRSIGEGKDGLGVNCVGLVCTGALFAFFCFTLPLCWRGGASECGASQEGTSAEPHPKRKSRLYVSSAATAPDTHENEKESHEDIAHRIAQCLTKNLDALMFWHALRTGSEDDEQTPRAVWSSDSLNGDGLGSPRKQAQAANGWSWLPGDWARVRAEQSQILTNLLLKQRHMILAIVLFQTVSSITAVELVEILSG